MLGATAIKIQTIAPEVWVPRVLGIGKGMATCECVSLAIELTINVSPTVSVILTRSHGEGTHQLINGRMKKSHASVVDSISALPQAVEPVNH